jgi:hypothetical protein
MNRNMLSMLAFPLFLGCNEYEIKNLDNVWGEPNPPVLESPTQQDRSIQSPIPAVDVLFVVDNSCSMIQEQGDLTDNFDIFIEYFVGSEFDWHVGVVSTDMVTPGHSGRLRNSNGVRFIDESVPNPVETFREMAFMGITGDPYEQGRAATYTALETLRTGYNAGFYRDYASLAVILVSDEDDYSGNQPVSRNEFIDWMLNLKASSDMVNFSSIVGPIGNCSTAYEEGTDYIAVTDAVGGIVWSICTDDWAGLLGELGMQAIGLKREFFLSELPVVDTLEVWVVFEGVTYTFDDGSCEDCYTYNASRNGITFNTYIPEPLAEVFIEYDVLAAQQYNDGDGDDTASE